MIQDFLLAPLFGLGVAVLQLVVHLVLGIVVLEILHVLDDVVDLVHGDVRQAEVADLHVGEDRQIALVAEALDIGPARTP